MMLIPSLQSELVEVLSLPDAKDHLRVFHNDEDDDIAMMIDGAVGHVENRTGRKLRKQTWDQPFAGFGCMRLAWAPAEVTAIHYWPDDGGAETTLPSGDYQTREETDGVYVSFVDGATWPALAARPDPVRVTFEAGYAEIPAPLLAAVKVKLTQMFVNRGAANDDFGDGMLFKSLVEPYRRFV